MGKTNKNRKNFSDKNTLKQDKDTLNSNVNKKERKIKNIVVKGKLSKGGMGQLYKGFHTDLEKDIVLKRVIIKNKDAELRFKNEAKILIDLHHENIVPVFDYFSSRGVYYILMDFIDGINLREIIEKYDNLPDYIILLILQQILKGFLYFHKKGIVHRDIKPENIILSKHGIIKIVDFGIAYSENVNKEINEKNLIIGTPKYIAPEVFKGEPITEKVDIYALGIILYELICGINPFNNLNEKQLFYQKKNGKIFPLRYFKDDVSYFFNNLVKKMVKKNPKKRPSAEKLIKIINRKILKLKIKNNEKVLEEYFFLNDKIAITEVEKTITIIDKKDNLSRGSKIIKQIQYNINKIFITFIVILFSVILYLGYNFVGNGTFNSVFHPYKFAPFKISIYTSSLNNDKHFDNNLLIYLNGKKIKNNEKYVVKSGINTLEIYYRGVFIYKELNLLSFKELLNIRKSFIPSKKILRIFKKFLINMDSLLFYKNIGEIYRKNLLISKDYKYNQFVITDITRFFSTKSFVKYTIFDRYKLNKIKNIEIYLKDKNDRYFLLKDGDENIYSFNLSFKIGSKEYYTKKIEGLNLSSSNYIYPVLEKKSGLLLFISNIKNIKVKINGEKIGWVGKETKKLKKYGKINKKYVSYYLTPGKYYIELIYKGRIYTVGPFDLVSLKTTKIIIKGDQNKINEINKINNK